jgi:hypothetical protein
MMPGSDCNPACPSYNPCWCGNATACDSDQDGVPDAYDACPWTAGSPATAGCPDDDADGIENGMDACPWQAGDFACNGCPNYCGSCTYTDCNANGIADACDLQAGGTSGPELMQNGGFEQATFNGCPNPCSTSCGFSLPFWSHGFITDDLIRNLEGCGPTHPGGGAFFVSLQGSVCCDCDNNGSITQQVALISGSSYVMAMDVFLDEYDAIEVSIGGSRSVFDASNVPTRAWSRVQMSFNANSPLMDLRIASVGTPEAPGCLEASYALIDNVSIRELRGLDCNGNGQLDSCEIARGDAPDCNNNGFPDACEMAGGGIPDCNGNGVPDSCDIASGSAQDCNGNGVPDSCDIVVGTAQDCNGNGIPDSCELASGWAQDCNGNAILDGCDIAQGRDTDYNWNGVPDACDAVGGPDCNQNGQVDFVDIAVGAAQDCNANGIPDSCDIANGSVQDCNGNGIPDTCDIAWGWAQDCNGNGFIDSCDIANGTASDCNWNSIPDSCEIANGSVQDCNGNGVPDACDIANGTASDCNWNSIPDSCEIMWGWVQDCNGNRVPDACEIANGSAQDCNGNGVLDTCEIASGAPDCDGNGRPDSCDISSGASKDLNTNMIPDNCEIADGREEDCDGDQIIDSYQQQLNLQVTLSTGQLGPIGYGSPRTGVLEAPPYALSEISVSVEVFGDFSSPSEYLTVYLNGRFVGEIYRSNYWGQRVDCQLLPPWTPGGDPRPMQAWLGIPADFFNDCVWTSTGPLNANFEFRPSIAVNAGQCPTGSWVRASLSYTAAITEDCNANGLLDVCETRDWPETDTNGNGIVDVCEGMRSSPFCPGDIDEDGEVGAGDISGLLVRFGMSLPGDPADLDRDGEVGAGDISMLLTLFGPC